VDVFNGQPLKYFIIKQLQDEVDGWKEKFENKELEFIQFKAAHDVDVEQLMALSRATQVKCYESEKEIESLRSDLELCRTEGEKTLQDNS